MGFYRVIKQFKRIIVTAFTILSSIASAQGNENAIPIWHSNSAQLATSEAIKKIDTSRNLILTFDSIKGAKAFQPTPNFKIVRAWSNYVVIKSNKPLSEEVTHQLEARKEIIHISIDQTLSAQDCESGICAPANESGLIDLKDKAFEVTNTVSLCTLQSTCAQTQLSDEWDIQSTNLDLMQAELKRLKIDLSARPIAVVDSPVDSKSLSTLSNKVHQKLENGESSKSDRNGHGTFVASKILAASPDSAITSFAVADEHGHAESSHLGEIIQKACENGFKVINLSMGSSIYGVPYDLSVGLPSLGEFLKSRGCILVQASGNEHDKGDLVKKPELSPFFQIGSLDVSGDKSDFSNTAQLYAPGGGVAGILPEGSEILNSVQSTKIYMCDGNRHLLPGTSFSTPLVSAVTNAVYTILEQSPAFKKLTPASQGEMVKQVLFRSAKNRRGLKVLDGFRAVMMAEALIKSSRSENPSAISVFPPPSEFLNIMKNSKEAKEINQTQQTSCHQIQSNCSARSECFRTKRKILALCNDTCGAGEDSVAADLYLTAINTGDFELAQTFAADLDREVITKLLAKANLKALSSRVDSLGEVSGMSKFISSNFLNGVPKELDEKMQERIRQEVILHDRNLQIESHLDYLINLESNSKWIDYSALTKKIWNQDHDKLDDRSLATLLSWNTSGSSNASTYSMIDKILHHPQASEYTLRFGAMQLSKLKTKEEITRAVQSILNHPKSDDLTISILLSSLPKLEISAKEREMLWDQIQNSSKIGKITELRSLQSLDQTVEDPSKKENILKNASRNIEKLHLTSDEKKAFGAIAAEQAAKLPGDSSIQLFSDIIRELNVDERSHFELARTAIENSPRPLETLKALAQSSAGYQKEPMSGLETFILIGSDRLTTAQKKEFLSSLKLNELPPKFVLEVHASKLTKSEQRELLTVYNRNLFGL